LDHGLGYKVYPNPASTQLTVEIEGQGSYESVELFDAMGRVVVRETLNNSEKNTIDLSNVPSGMYVVRLLGKAQQATESLWIRK
jgi:hypothetical protein